jgi:hypothetical protein
VSELQSLLDQIAGLELDPDALSDGELLDGIPGLQGGINQLSALMTRWVAAAERREAQRADGMVSMKTWLTGHCRLSGRDAAGLVRAGRRLVELPELAAAYAEGAVTAAHVDVVVAAVTPARVATAEGHGIDLITTDRVLAEAARSLGPEDTAKAVRRWVAGSIRTGPSTRQPGCRGCFGRPSVPVGASTCPGTSTRSVERPCTPCWRR